MRIALLADPHANRFAAERIERELTRYAPDVVICLGDVVGYNAHPVEVTDWVKHAASVVVRGNHDVDATRPPAPRSGGTTAAARIAQDWTRSVLRDDQSQYLAHLPNVHVETDEYVAVHGCYLNDHHYTGYVTSTMLGHNLERIARRDDLPAVAFCGHTHQPMCGYLRHGEIVEPKPVGRVEWPADADAVIVNPGSIGQPRDGDPRSSFAIVDLALRTVTFLRVDYAVEAARSAILEAGLPSELAHRLGEGR